MTEFHNLGLAETILRAVKQEGYTSPTPIQTQAIPAVLAGRDLLGIAQTGTGKTAAFALPILHRLAQSGARPAPKHCRALVLAPTRELAQQITESFRAYGRHTKLSAALVVGGVKYGPQIAALNRGVDILVATPGRLVDHMQSGAVRLSGTEIVVLDEADHMLDLGFLVAIRRILKDLPAKRQNLFFSATMPQKISALAHEMLRDPVRVEVTPVATTVDKVNQQVYLIEADRKRPFLADMVSGQEFMRTLVFTRTKHGADKVCAHLAAAGLSSAAIHGNKTQAQRERALAGFKAGKTRILVATDIAARGIDVEGVTHVVNFELPNIAESYVHRIGRTARAGAEGVAISFCDNHERAFLRDIEKLTRQIIPVSDMRTSRDHAPREARNNSSKNNHNSSRNNRSRRRAA